MTAKHSASTQPRAILLDMDGVLYHGDSPLPGAIEFMDHIQHIRHCFITNNPIRLPEEIADRLQQQGFTRPGLNSIITSGEATASWLAKQKRGFRYFAVGAKGLHQALEKYGTPDEQRADFVIIGEGEGLDYQSLTTGINLILKNGAQLISTNPDHTVDATINGQHRILPGGGALVAPFITATGEHPITIGKPNPLLYEIALEQLGVIAADCLMIGDRPDTDIIGAAELGMRTALVRSGRFHPQDNLPDYCDKPDWDVNSLAELQRLLRQTFPGWLEQNQ